MLFYKLIAFYIIKNGYFRHILCIYNIVCTVRSIHVTATFVHEFKMLKHLQLCSLVEYDSLILFAEDH